MDRWWERGKSLGKKSAKRRWFLIRKEPGLVYDDRSQGGQLKGELKWEKVGHCRRGQLTVSFSAFPIPTFFNSPSFAPLPRSSKGSAPFSVARMSHRTGTKSAFCVSSVISRGDCDTSAANSTSIASRTLSPSPAPEPRNASHARLRKSVAFARRAKSVSQSFSTSSNALHVVILG